MNEWCAGGVYRYTATMRHVIATLSLVLMAACSDGDGVPSDATAEGGRDAEVDASDSSIQDADLDATMDASAPDASDSGMDSSMCACSSGPCCDGCGFRPASYVCAITHPFPSSCAGSSTFCGGKARRLDLIENEVHCSGSGSACNGATVDTSRSIDCYEPTPGNFEQYGVCMPPAGELPARCALNCGL